MSFQQITANTPGDNEWTDCHRASNGELPTRRPDAVFAAAHRDGSAGVVIGL